MICTANARPQARGAAVTGRRLRPGALKARWLAAAAALALGASAFGQVTLERTVRKVETTLEPSGRVKRELMPVEQVVPGEELRYSVTFTNESDMVVDAERIVITVPLPEGTVYVSGTAGGEATRVEYSADGENFTGSEPPASPDAGAPTRPAAAPGAAPEAAGAPGVRALRWTYQQDLKPAEAGELFFHVRMQ